MPAIEKVGACGRARGPRRLGGGSGAGERVAGSIPIPSISIASEKNGLKLASDEAASCSF
jgi:hypothetical protein